MQYSGKVSQNSREKLSNKCEQLLAFVKKNKINSKGFCKSQSFQEDLKKDLNKFYIGEIKKSHLLGRGFPCFPQSIIITTITYKIKYIKLIFGIKGEFL